MSAFTSAGNGNWNAGATWGNGGNTEGTDYPGNADTASIGHTVTVNGAYPASGSLGAITITTGGKLQYSTSASQTLSLELAGNLVVNSGGEFDMGTATGAIPSTSTASLVFNVASNNQYGMTWSAGSTVKLQGTPPTYDYTTLASAIVANDNHFHTTDTTGWVVGDSIIVHATTRGQVSEEVIITGISGTTVYIDSAGNGSQATPKFTNAHVSGIRIGNLIRNVKIKTKTATYYANSIAQGATGSTFSIVGVEFNNLGSLVSSGSSGNPVCNSYSYCSVRGNLYAIYISSYSGHTITFDHLILHSSGFSENGNVTVTNSLVVMSSDYTNMWRYGTNNSTNTIFVAQPSTYCMRDGAWVLMDSCQFWSSNRDESGYTWFTYATVYSMNNCSFDANNASILLNGMGIKKLTNCSFGQIVANVYDITVQSSGSGLMFMTNCIWSTIHYITYLDTTNKTLGSIRSQNHGQVAGRHKTQQAYGIISDEVTGGQASSWARGGSGICVYLDPSSTTAGQTLDWEFYIPVTASTAFQLKFYVKTTQTSNGPTLSCTIYDSDDDITALLSAESVVLTSASDWTLYTATSCTPTNTGFCRVVLKCLNGSSTGDVGVDDVSVV